MAVPSLDGSLLINGAITASGGVVPTSEMKWREPGLCFEFRSQRNAGPLFIQLQKHPRYGELRQRSGTSAHRLEEKADLTALTGWPLSRTAWQVVLPFSPLFRAGVILTKPLIWSFGAWNGMVILKEVFHVSVPKWLLWLKIETATLLKPLLSRWEGNYGF